MKAVPCLPALRRATAPAAFVAASLAACGAALAADAPSRIHVVRTNETSPEALAGARTYATLMASNCRSILHMPPAEVTLTDAQLSKITYREEEIFFEGDRIAHYVTIRFVIADSSSQCQPYVWVHRDARIAEGCDASISGDSGPILDSAGPPAAPPTWSPSTRVGPGQCGEKRRERSTEGVPADDAGAGQTCVWGSRLMFARLGPALKSRLPAGEPGNGPAAKGLDTCLWQRMPDYRPPNGKSEAIVLRHHTPPDPDPQHDEAQLGLTGGHRFFEGNDRTRKFEIDGPPGGTRLTKAGVEAFVRLPPKESVPAQ